MVADTAVLPAASEAVGDASGEWQLAAETFAHRSFLFVHPFLVIFSFTNRIQRFELSLERISRAGLNRTTSSKNRKHMISVYTVESYKIGGLRKVALDTT